MMSVRAAVHKDGENWHTAAARNRRRPRKGIRLLSEEIDDDAVAARRILIAEQPDDPALIDHAEHLAYARTIGDVHPDKRTVLIDEAIHPRCTLPFCHADNRQSCQGERTAHELPVAAVRGCNDCSLALRQCRAHRIQRPRDRHVVLNMTAQDGKAQHLHQHRSKAQRTLPRDALCLCGRYVKAALDLRLREPLAPRGDKRPKEARQSRADHHGGAVRQETDEMTEKFDRPVRQHLSSFRAVLRWSFRGL